MSEAFYILNEEAFSPDRLTGRLEKMAGFMEIPRG